MVYGGDQITANWVKSAVEAAVRNEPYLLEHGGDQTLEMVHIEDAVYCSCAALTAEKINQLAVYNVVSHCVTLKAALAEIKRQIPQFEYQAGDGVITEAQGVWDIEDTVRDLGYHPKYTLSYRKTSILQGQILRPIFQIHEYYGRFRTKCELLLAAHSD